MILYPITIPGGSDTHVQYNKNGIFGGATYLTYDDVNGQTIIGKTSSAYPFLIKSADGSDQIEIYHDNEAAYFNTSDGYFYFTTTETDANFILDLRGNSAGRAYVRCYDNNQNNRIEFNCYNGTGNFSVLGSSPHSFRFQPQANADISMFADATDGETRTLSIIGFGSGSGGRESLDITVEKTTANTVEFEGLDSYNFTGTLKSTAGAQLGDGGVTNYVDITATGVVSLNGLAGLQLPHMMQSDSTNQTVSSPNVAQVVTFNTDVHHFGITRTTASRFTILKEASYLIAISALCDTTVANKDIEVWLRINGSDVANTNTIVHLGTAAETTLAVTYIKHFDVGDYFEFWMTGENTGCRLLATAAVTTGGEERPACPSIIMTCNYIGVD